MNLIKQEKGGTELATTGQLRFDYNTLDKSIRAEAKENAQLVFDAINTAGKAFYDIGLAFIQQKDLLGHGMFATWVEQELGWKLRSAEMYMTIPERFPRREDYNPLLEQRDRDMKALPDNIVTYEEIADLNLSTQQVLAAPSVPIEKVREVIDLAATRKEQGAALPTVREVKAVVSGKATVNNGKVHYVTPTPAPAPEPKLAVTASYVAPAPTPAPTPVKGRVTYVQSEEVDATEMVRHRLELNILDLLELATSEVAGNTLEYWWRQYQLTRGGGQCDLEEWAKLVAMLRSMKRCVQEQSFGA